MLRWWLICISLPCTWICFPCGLRFFLNFIINTFLVRVRVHWVRSVRNRVGYFVCKKKYYCEYTANCTCTKTQQTLSMWPDGKTRNMFTMKKEVDGQSKSESWSQKTQWLSEREVIGHVVHIRTNTSDAPMARTYNKSMKRQQGHEYLIKRDRTALDCCAKSSTKQNPARQK